MRTRKRLLAVGIVGAAVIAACIGSLTLSETEQQTMSYPTAGSAGNVMVGQSGTTQAIVFTPATGSDDDTIMSVTESCAKWTLNLNPLPQRVYCDMIASADVGGGTYGSGSCVPTTYSFTGTFTPSGPGIESCVVTVTYRSTTTPVGSGSGSGSGSSTLTVVLYGNGVAPSYAISTNPAANSTLQYTDIPIPGPSSTQPITVTNTGTATVTVNGSSTNLAVFPVMPSGTANFASQILTVGQSATYNVACVPTAVQPYTGAITFSTNQTQGGLSKVINLACNGITSNLTIDPNPAAFARNTLVGKPPSNLTITIMNNGAQTAFSNVHLETGGEVHIVSGPQSPLAGMTQTTIVLSYDAATEHPSGTIDNLILTHTPGGTRTIAINAEALVGEIGVSPGVVDFGPVCSGSVKTSDLMVYATSSGPVNLMGITQPGSPFSVTGTPGPLQPNHGNIISLTARVTAAGPGDLDDTFTLDTNLPGAGMTHEVQLKGVALPSGVTPTPNLVHFGPGRVDSTTTAKHITISNCGTGPLAITGARIEGPSQNDFAIVGPEDPLQTIPMMGELEFLVVMNPQTTGTKTAKLIVEYEGGVAEADLDGNGFGLNDGGGEKETYYTCSAGGVGGFPLVLAALLLRRRRRRA